MPNRTWSFLGLASLFFASAAPAIGDMAFRTNLIQAIFSEDAAEQIELVKKLIQANDPLVEQALAAWRQGGLYFYETNETKTPFLLDAATDAEGRAKAIRVADGEFLKDDKGQPFMFAAAEITAVDTSSKLRKAIKTTLDLFALGNRNPNMRRDAVVKLGQELNAEYLPHFTTRLASEQDKVVRKALAEAIALTQSAGDDVATRVAAIQQLGEMRSINALSFLQQLEKECKASPAKFGQETLAAAHFAVQQIENYVRWGSLYGTAFRGVSLSAVLLVAALGLA